MSDIFTSVLSEKRVFKPSSKFASEAVISGEKKYRDLIEWGERDPEGFWAEQAKRLHWFQPWDKTLEWDEPYAKWFVNGKLNVSHNCLDRHLSSQADKTAILWEGEPGDQRNISYRELHEQVCKFASSLKDLGLKKGDRVTLYLPMIPELAISMLACARLGLIHSVVFAGFSAEALRTRINDAESKVLITSDGGHRKGKIVALKQNADEALQDTPSIEKVVVVKRTDSDIAMSEGRDVWWHELIEKGSPDCEAVALDAEDPLFILYTSGTTGVPKGVVHTTGGYLTQVSVTTQWIFDLKPDDLYWCTADIGWVTGHSYIVYGPLSNGTSVFMYEGAPDFPAKDRFWDIVERHKINILYTAPTVIRTFMGWGEEWPNRHNLESLRLLGTVGEPINPEAWMWYHKVIGKERCPVVDTWWQTETGAIMISPLPGATPAKPGSATLPFPGIKANVLSMEGEPVPPEQGGYLVIERPWPGMLRTIFKNPERYEKEYWAKIGGVYFSGDGSRRDNEGYFWIMGRIDDVINVSGHRLGTMEIESALVSHDYVSEAAVVGRPDAVKGQAIVAFITLNTGVSADGELKKDLSAHVMKEIGPIARPDEYRVVPALPKTRSGKIMRRVLRDIALGVEIKGDISTIEDAGILNKLMVNHSDSDK